MNLRRPYYPVLLIVEGVLACTLAGCAPQDEPRRYRVPKEAVAESAPHSGMKSSAVAPPTSGGPRLSCDTPKGWSPGDVGGMRKLAFVVQDGERKVEITAIDLAASGSALLPNVNRWRQQIQLGEITPEELNKVVKPILVAGQEGQYVELVGPEEATPRRAILGVVAVRGERAWFFKLSGDADLALREKERFEEFVKSVRFVSPQEARAPSVATAAVRGDSPLEYDAPAGWTVGEAGGMRRAVFQVTEGDLKVEITVLEVAGSVESLLLNVNRWRRQVQLGEITQTELEKTVRPIQVGGLEGHYVELLGPEDAPRRLAATRVVASLAGKTWLFSMTGDAILALREKERFQRFVKSVKFSRADGSQHGD